MSGGSKNIKQAFLFFWKNYFISISVNVGIFNSVLYIDTCNFVMGWNRETSFVTRPDPCQGVKKMCARLRRTLTALGIAILLWQSSYGLSAQRIANGKCALYKPTYLWYTRVIRSVLLHQARGMSGGSKNIKQAFLLYSKVYFISISVNVGIAKTARRFVDQLLWHTREIRSVL